MTSSIMPGLVTFKTIVPNEGLQAALARSRSDVIHEISASKLKGRGGAGFPTGVKWNLAAAACGEPKYIVCNADEGEPGTFKDRVILSEIADIVFEGMTIAAYAIGATKGILYLRGEYTYLRASLEDVLRKRREANLLGDKILGSDLSFDIDIHMGAGAYVCGEETALIESLEGHRGEPRNRPPFPVDTGFQGKPTVVNNVETFVCAAAILGKGAAWFSAIGTEKSSGPKLFSVSGDCDRPGVYEFPLGVTIEQLLDVVGGNNAKAVQVGGASDNASPQGNSIEPSVSRMCPREVPSLYSAPNGTCFTLQKTSWSFLSRSLVGNVRRVVKAMPNSSKASSVSKKVNARWPISTSCVDSVKSCSFPPSAALGNPVPMLSCQSSSTSAKN